MMMVVLVKTGMPLSQSTRSAKTHLKKSVDYESLETSGGSASLVYGQAVMYICYDDYLCSTFKLPCFWSDEMFYPVSM